MIPADRPFDVPAPPPSPPVLPAATTAPPVPNRRTSPQAPRLLREKVLLVTAAIRGVSVWGWHTNFSVTDESGAQIGSGTGLGRGGQIMKKGFALKDPGGAVVVEVRPVGKQSVVTDATASEIGRFGRQAQGVKGVIKPTYAVQSGGALLAEVLTETHRVNRWAVCGPGGTEIANIVDITKIGLFRSTSATNRIEVDGEAHRNLRALILAIGTDLAAFRMKYYNRPRGAR